jgi:peptidoglycan hydrolase-like protein with peptidoglycan-binding domain
LVCLTAALVLPGSASASAPDVAALQVALRIGGTYSGGIDGIFGPETQSAGPAVSAKRATDRRR